MALREKYAYAIQTAKGVRMEGSAEERDGKLHFHGFVDSQDDANQIWSAIKTIPEWRTEVVADIRATSGTASSKTADSQATDTVKPGDTLSKAGR